MVDTKKERKKAEIDSKILAIKNLMSYSEWKVFSETILWLQGANSAKLFTRKFIQLNPEDKDKEHRVIVAVNEVLNRLLNLPQWLERQQPAYWNQVVEYLMQEANENG